MHYFWIEMVSMIVILRPFYHNIVILSLLNIEFMMVSPSISFEMFMKIDMTFI